MNYSTLLTRSVDFGDYALILYPSYPVEVERPLLLSMIQMMWDRGEPDGYAQPHDADPLPDTPAHKVADRDGVGDHQVANVATEVEARTIGTPLRRPALDAGADPRTPRRPTSTASRRSVPLRGPLRTATGCSCGTSARSGSRERETKGTDPPPTTNAAPDDSFGVDPHDTVIDDSPLIRAQIANFLKVERQDHRSLRRPPLLRGGLERDALTSGDGHSTE